MERERLLENLQWAIAVFLTFLVAHIIPKPVVLIEDTLTLDVGYIVHNLLFLIVPTGLLIYALLLLKYVPDVSFRVSAWLLLLLTHLVFFDPSNVFWLVSFSLTLSGIFLVADKRELKGGWDVWNLLRFVRFVALLVLLVSISVYVTLEKERYAETFKTFLIEGTKGYDIKRAVYDLIDKGISEELTPEDRRILQQQLEAYLQRYPEDREKEEEIRNKLETLLLIQKRAFKQSVLQEINRAQVDIEGMIEALEKTDSPIKSVIENSHLVVALLTFFLLSILMELSLVLSSLLGWITIKIVRRRQPSSAS